MDEWHYTRGGQQMGPVGLFELRKMVVNGVLSAEDLVWTKGMASWEPAGANATLKTDFAALARRARLTPSSQPPVPPTAAPKAPTLALPSSPPAGVSAINVPAGHWARIGAALIDTLIGATLGALMGVLWVLTEGDLDSATPSLLGAAIGMAYYVGMHASGAMATLGKMALGLIVVDTSGQRIGVLRSLGRYLILGLTSLTGVLLIVFLMNRKHRGLHDMAAGTVVIQKSTYAPTAFSFRALDAGPTSAGVIVAIVLLVLAVPLIGIVAAIAIPAYQDYTARSVVMSALARASTHKAAIEEHLYQTDYSPIASYSEIGVDGAYVTDDGVAVIDFTPYGTISVTMQNPPLEGKAFSLVPQISGDDIVWECRPVDIEPKYLPSMCRP